MKTTAFIVADWFIAHNNAVVRYNSADNISNLKIQKLLSLKVKTTDGE